MKRFVATALASIMLLSAVSCGRVVFDTETSVTASDAEQILIDRLGGIPENVVLGDATVAAEYGIDMSNFESDGYVLRTVGDSTLIFGKTEDGLDRAVRAYVKAVKGDYANDLDVVYHEGYRIERLTIAGRDISEYTVYYPETANENMKFAAEELVRLVEIATGVRLPVVVGTPVSPSIELRHSDDPGLRDEGYVYTVTESGLIIEGAVKRGCMNGVWRFLQKECGWDELIYGESCLQESDHIDVPVGTDRTETPIFDYIYIHTDYPHNNDRTAPTKAQNSYGAVSYACHGMQNYRFCAEDYSNYQICYNSEERYEECRDNVEKYILGNISDPDFKEIDISQGDNDGFCYCELCVDVFVAEGYTHAGSVVRFANRLSEELNENYPGIIYKIFAYWGTNKPPKTAPGEYVYVTFCYDRNCANHKIDGTECTGEIVKRGESNNNSDYAEWFNGWSDLTSNMYVWYYQLECTFMQHTPIDVLYDDFRYFRDRGVKGIMAQYDNQEFGIKRLEMTLVSELNWNPDMTREEYEAHFCRLLEKYFGDGWHHIREYVDHWTIAQDLTQCWHCWVIWAEDQYIERFDIGFYRDRFDNFVELFDAALAETNSLEQERNIERLSIAMLHMGCYSSYYWAYIEGDTERMAVLSDRYDQFIMLIRKYGLKYQHSIGGNIEEAASKIWKARFTAITGKEPPAEFAS